MSIDEWAKEFVKTWRSQQKRTPEHYPEDMEPGEWDSQYRAHTEV